jgi:hypothetical protein
MNVDKFEQDARLHSLQVQAMSAAREEKDATDKYLAGVYNEEDLLSFMSLRETAGDAFIKAGGTWKDLRCGI